MFYSFIIYKSYCHNVFYKTTGIEDINLKG